jgi:NhaP-type Na+/H+ or K+/H+ antiporter
MLVVIGAGFVIYGLVAGRLDRLWVSAPIVFVALGIAVSHWRGDHLLPDTEWVKLTTELTLAVLLFVDASTIKRREAGSAAALPGRLLGIGLPLTGLVGALVALAVLPGLGWATCALLACILAPTDAALGLATITNEVVPQRIRLALNIESGLNDGLATPFVYLFLSIVLAESNHGTGIAKSIAGVFAGIGIGLGIGIVVGALGAIVARASWMESNSAQLVVLATPLFCYAAAAGCGANGFVATYVCGFAFGAASRHQFTQAAEFTESVGLYASFAVWLIFGALFAGPVLQQGFELRPVLYAVLSLTVVRMAPVAIAFIGTGLRTETTLFVGWFGPRGLASVVFTLLAVERLTGNGALPLMAQVATWTILGSVVLHGVTATPFSDAYGRRMASLTEDARELEPVDHSMTFRRRSLKG